MKVVINGCYGGFGLSHEAVLRYYQLKEIPITFKKKPFANQFFYEYQTIDGNALPQYEIPRDDPALVQVVEEMGEDANGNFSELRITEIPDGIKWYIDEYDGIETVREEHRSWS